jgi:hypothetical protein
MKTKIFAKKHTALKKVLYGTILSASVCVAVLYANDTKITVASGGLVIEKAETDIEMKSEKLEISLKKIKVSYDFFNHGETKKINVGFPLPKSPYFMEHYPEDYPYSYWDEVRIALRTFYGDSIYGEMTNGLDSLLNSLTSQLEQAEIIDFSVSVNSNRVDFVRHIRAHNQKGDDITDLLKKHRIPISSAYLIGHQEDPPMNNFPGLKEQLKSLDLLNEKDLPNWYLQTTYAWDQEYVGHQITKVEHTYTPSSGAYWIDIKDFENQGKNSVRKEDPFRKKPLNLDECTVDLEHFKKFMEMWKTYVNDHGPDRTYKRIDEVQYVLKSGANWRGPIGKFRLEIKPDNPDDLIIVEGKYPLKRQSDGVCVVELQNFTPTENLRIWMLQTKYEWDEWDAQQEALKPTVWKRFKSWVMRFISAK